MFQYFWMCIIYSETPILHSQKICLYVIFSEFLNPINNTIFCLCGINWITVFSFFFQNDNYLWSCHLYIISWTWNDPKTKTKHTHKPKVVLWNLLTLQVKELLWPYKGVSAKKIKTREWLWSHELLGDHFLVVEK